MTATWSEHIDASEHVKQTVYKDFRSVKWESEGREFLSKPYKFPNGEMGMSTEYVGEEGKFENHRLYDKEVTLETGADNFIDVLRGSEILLRNRFCPKMEFEKSEFLGV
jgi:hypothetical protein